MRTLCPSPVTWTPSRHATAAPSTLRWLTRVCRGTREALTPVPWQVTYNEAGGRVSSV